MGRKYRVGKFWYATYGESQEGPSVVKGSRKELRVRKHHLVGLMGTEKAQALQRESQMCAVRKWCNRWCVRSRVKDFRVHLTQACRWWGRSEESVTDSESHSCRGSEPPSPNLALRFGNTSVRTLTSFMLQQPTLWTCPGILSKVCLRPWARGRQIR